MARTQSADYDLRRAHIVDQAATLFADRGFKATSVSEMANAASVSKSLIYHYFPSKEDVLWAVMSSHVDTLLNDTERLLAESGSPKERLRNLLRTFTRHYVGAGDRQKVLLNELRSLPLEQRSDIVRKQRRIVDGVQTLVVAIEPRLTGSPDHARAKTMLLFGMINWMHTWYNPKGAISPEDVADLALKMVQAS